MNEELASRIINAAVSLDSGLGEIDSAIREIEDEDEKNVMIKKLGEVFRMINESFIRGIVKTYRHLDPDK